MGAGVRVPAAGAAVPPGFPASIRCTSRATGTGPATSSSTTSGRRHRRRPPRSSRIRQLGPRRRATSSGSRLDRTTGRRSSSPPARPTPTRCCSSTTQHLKTVSISGGLAGDGDGPDRRHHGGAPRPQLETAGYGLAATPPPGDLTLGGVLAIDGHGTAIPANGETRDAGDDLRLAEQPRHLADRGRVGRRARTSTCCGPSPAPTRRSARC